MVSPDACEQSHHARKQVERHYLAGDCWKAPQISGGQKRGADYNDRDQSGG
jgi:hypothetical protein